MLVSGNYQAGIRVVDFSDAANAQEIAYADPPPLVDPNPPVGIELGDDWSTYWYSGRIYESDTTRCLISWRLDDHRVGTFVRTPYLNPPNRVLDPPVAADGARWVAAAAATHHPPGLRRDARGALSAGVLVEAETVVVRSHGEVESEAPGARTPGALRLGGVGTG